MRECNCVNEWQNVIILTFTAYTPPNMWGLQIKKWNEEENPCSCKRCEIDYELPTIMEYGSNRRTRRKKNTIDFVFNFYYGKLRIWHCAWSYCMCGAVEGPRLYSFSFSITKFPRHTNIHMYKTKMKNTKEPVASITVA